MPAELVVDEVHPNHKLVRLPRISDYESNYTCMICNNDGVHWVYHCENTGCEDVSFHPMCLYNKHMQSSTPSTEPADFTELYESHVAGVTCSCVYIPQTLKCKMAHDLVPINIPPSYVPRKCSECDSDEVRNNEDGTASFVLHSKNCKYDVCEDHSKGGNYVSCTCDVALYPYNGGSVGCDRCGRVNINKDKDATGNKAFWHCYTCNYDMCQNCEIFVKATEGITDKPLLTTGSTGDEKCVAVWGDLDKGNPKLFHPMQVNR